MARDVELNVTAADRTGTALTSMERNFKRTQDKIKRDQEKASADFGKLAGKLAGTGADVGMTFGQSLVKGLRGAGPAAAAVLGGMAIYAAPLIGASIAGAVIGGAGIGGVIGGVALAARDPRVKAAGTQLGENILSSLEARANVFVQPVLDAITEVQDRFDDVGDDISRIFANSAKFVQPLVAGVTVALQRITQAVAKLTDGAGPVIEVISQGIADLGDAVGDVFEDLADDGISAAVALGQVFQILEFTIRGVGIALNVLTESYGFLAKIGAFGRDAQLEYIRLTQNAKIAAAANNDVTTSLDGTRTAGAGAAAAIAELVNAVGDLTEENRTLYGSQTSAAEAIARTKEAIKDNGKTLDLNTEKGRNNRRALEGLATALTAQFDAAVKVNGVGPQTDAIAASNRESFIRLATQLTGSKQKAIELANSLLGIPKDTKPKVSADTKAALDRIRALEARLKNIPDEQVLIQIREEVSRRYPQSRDNADYLKNAAGDRWSKAGLDGITSRTSGPTEVRVDQALTVNLDGAPFRAMTSQAIASNDRRNALRAKVGTR